VTAARGKGSERRFVRSVITTDETTSNIDNYFRDKDVPIKTKKITVGEFDYYCIAAYPYSGVNTIDVYCFVHDGDIWRLHMLYYALNPPTRALEFKTEDRTITVYGDRKKLVTMFIEK
jgi:hypothetical protein